MKYIKNNLNSIVDSIIEKTIELYPKIEYVSIEISYDTTSNNIDLINTFGICCYEKDDDVFKIILNIDNNAMMLLTTIFIHEISHVVDKTYNNKFNHGKSFKRIEKKILHEMTREMKSK